MVKMKFDQDLCTRTCDMNSTLGSVVPLAMFWDLAPEDVKSPKTSDQIEGHIPVREINYNLSISVLSQIKKEEFQNVKQYFVCRLKYSLMKDL